MAGSVGQEAFSVPHDTEAQIRVLHAKTLAFSAELSEKYAYTFISSSPI